MNYMPPKNVQSRPTVQGFLRSEAAELMPIRQTYQDSDRRASEAFSNFCDLGQWQMAIELVVAVVGITEADLAKDLGVSRSTVNRWRTVGSRPLESAMPEIKESIRELILRRH